MVPLPGPNAAVTALIASGLPTDGFTFLGFLKKKSGKMKKELRAAAQAGKTIIFYESPHRVAKTLLLCGEIFDPATPVALGRELTKKFEEFIRGTLQEVAVQVQGRELKGEFVVLLHPPLPTLPLEGGGIKGEGEENYEEN